ncbi:hypothetical protein ACPWSR_05215 [Alloiococcus sp. CFN-8]|uniref:hypothetical protein n=1 Tax=Alloiococcus sp. CFN-8 TaxID=3416081 RepID=UPI003CF264BB
MYENMNNKIARSIKIFGNLIGVFGVIAGFYTLIVGADSAYAIVDVYESVDIGAIFISAFSTALEYIIIMFIFWGLAEIIELLSVIKANTTNQVELTAQGNNITPDNISTSDTSVSED